MFERLKMSFVAGNHIVDMSSHGTLKDPMVGIVMHDILEVYGWQNSLTHRPHFQERILNLRIHPPKFVMQGPPQFAFYGR